MLTFTSIVIIEVSMIMSRINRDEFWALTFFKNDSILIFFFFFKTKT